MSISRIAPPQHGADGLGLRSPGPATRLRKPSISLN